MAAAATPHWLGGVGVGGFADFQALMGADPNFAAAWGDISGQLNAEGASSALVTHAQSAFADAFQQLPSDVGDTYAAARDYVMVGHTILGAVGTISGLVNAATSGSPIEIAQAFTGTMIGLSVAVGAVSAGVGAAVVGLLSAAVGLLESAGLFGSPPAAGSICGCPVQVQPDFSIGCLAVWGSKVAPGAANWRQFPQPNNPADAAWFEGGSQHVGPGRWRDAFFGIRGPDQDQSYSGCPNPAGVNIRPIDNAFGAYIEIGMLVDTVFSGGGGYSGAQKSFLMAFINAWEANAAFSLNGLKPQPDSMVLAHAVRLWNRAHDASSTEDVSTFGGFIAWLVADARNYLSSSELSPSGGLSINTGGMRVVAATSSTPRTLALRLGPNAQAAAQARAAASASGPSTGAKVAGGTAIVAGSALAGSAVYAWLKGEALGQVWSHIWRAASKPFRK